MSVPPFCMHELPVQAQYIRKVNYLYCKHPPYSNTLRNRQNYLCKQMFALSRSFFLIHILFGNCHNCLGCQIVTESNVAVRNVIVRRDICMGYD